MDIHEYRVIRNQISLSALAIDHQLTQETVIIVDPLIIVVLCL